MTVRFLPLQFVLVFEDCANFFKRYIQIYIILFASLLYTCTTFLLYAVRFNTNLAHSFIARKLPSLDCSILLLRLAPYLLALTWRVDLLFKWRFYCFFLVINLNMCNVLNSIALSTFKFKYFLMGFLLIDRFYIIYTNFCATIYCPVTSAQKIATSSKDRNRKDTK